MAGAAAGNGVAAERDGEVLRLALSGPWTLFADRPSFAAVLKRNEPAAGDLSEIVVDASEVTEWDSALVAFLAAARSACSGRGARFRTTELPGDVEKLLEQVPRKMREPASEKTVSGPTFVTLKWIERAGAQGRAIFRFTGELVLSACRLLRKPGRFRWADSLEAMQQTGAQALPIVGLISFLVGVIMAYQASIQLKQFGAEIFVANLVGIAVVREMGPMMAAIVLCGRTGAAFAAQIGTMKVNEEIDALKTLGASEIDFLVMPRMVALFLMMPLLTIYADLLGVLGGLFVATVSMEILPVTYLSQTQNAISLPDIWSGLIKGVFFGGLIAFSGCFRGLQCKRNSAGVGAAATSAVVMGILLVILADALFAVIFDRLGI